MRYVGTSVQRVEDDRLLSGNGSYIADLDAPGLLHAAFVRSPLPHARIVSIDAGAARRLPGVVAVITGAEMATFTNRLFGLAMFGGLYTPPYHALATDRVRHVGDPVALVVAESRYVAEDAIELVDVEYDALPAIATIDDALDASRPPLWDKAKSNVLFTNSRSHGDVDGAFAAADRVITRTFVGHRHSNQPMETRGCAALIDGATGTLTFHSATQNTHGLRWYLGLLTDRRSIPRSLKDLATTQREQLKRVVRGVREFAAANGEALNGGDNSGAVSQFRTDPSSLLDLLRSVIGLAAKGAVGAPHVEAGDIGGAFGAKASFWREEVAVASAAIHLRRSIKWIEDRNEHLANGGHARDERMRVSAAVTNDGEILGLKTDLVMDQGAYPAMPFGAAMFTQIMRVMMPGVYRMRGFEFDAKVVATNKGTYVAYRGPWAMETWTRERLIDVIARELDLTPEAVRLRNMVAADELPRPMITGPMLDVRMSARATLDKALEIVDLPAFRAEQLAARDAGRALGIGIATFHEAAPGPPGFAEQLMEGATMLASEPVRTVLEADGTVSVYLQQMPHGQGHETTFAQVAADELGCLPSDVRVRVGNTRVTPFGLMGTGGSRAGAMAGGAVTFATRELREQMLDRASELLEANVDDLQVTDGRIHVAGVPAISVSFADVAGAVARDGGEPLRTEQAYDGGEGGWTMATHACWVEVDLDTGFVTIPRYVVVEDCGQMINPAIVEGQIRGGVAQGVGAVLYEKIHYDADANFQSGTFADYLIPTSMEIPEIEIVHIETPTDIEANFRGVGEGGMILAPAAISNAIEDALAHLGVEILEQHMPPTRILELTGTI